MPLQRSDLGAYSRLVCFLETLGAVKTASALFSKDNNTSADIEKCQFFYEQICSLIRNADLVIVEVTTPSLRVGYEIAYAEAFSKPVLALHKTNDLLYEGQPLSPFLQGNKRIAICNYEHTDQAIAHCRSFFMKACKRAQSRGVRIQSKGHNKKRWSDLRVQDLMPAEASEGRMLWFHGDDKLDAVITGLSLHRYLCAPIYNTSGKFIGMVDMQDVLAFVLKHVLSNNPAQSRRKVVSTPKTKTRAQQPQVSAGHRDPSVAADQPAMSSSLPPIKNSRSSARKQQPSEIEKDKTNVATLAAKIAQMGKSGGILKSTYARDVINMSGRNPCVPADPDTPLLKVMTTLAEGTYRVPIINAKGRVIRILSQMAMCELLAGNVELWAQESKLTLPSPFRVEKVVKVADNSTALNAFSKIQTNAVSGVGVIDQQGRLIADLTPADLKSMKHVELLLGPVTRFTEGTPIRQVLTIPEEQTERVTLKRVVQKMVETGAHRFYILNSGKPSAALSITDVLKGFTSPGTGLWCHPHHATTSRSKDTTTDTKVNSSSRPHSRPHSRPTPVPSVVIDGTALETKHSITTTVESPLTTSPNDVPSPRSRTGSSSRKDKSRTSSRKERRKSQR